MHNNSRFNLLIFVSVLPLLLGCTVPKAKSIHEPVIGMVSLSSYRVEDLSGSLNLPVDDIIVDYNKSGAIDYIVADAPLSGFDLDIRTAPSHANQVILIPRQLASLETEREIFKLQVGILELINAPRFSLPFDTFPGGWKDTVEHYWEPYTEY